jgi:uncharacterized membrane protein (UPF0127 family)
VSLLLLACAKAGPPTTTIEVGGRVLEVAVADDPAERAQGLMYRERLGPDDGMLFVYPDAQERSFWMKNTRIPLTIAYLSPDGSILHLADMTPFSLDPVPSIAPAMYALEMNQGWYATNGVALGSTVRRLPAASAR